MVNTLNIIGLIFNTVAAIILISPNIKRTRNVNDEYITFMNQKTGDYTQNKNIKDQKINIIASILLAIGFMFQLVSTFFE